VLAGPQEQAQHSDYMQDSNSVQVTLALKDGKTTYRMGEAILLDLSFTATKPGYAIKTTTTQPASPIDEITITPADGVFSWLEDSSGGHRYYPDYGAIEELSPGVYRGLLDSYVINTNFRCSIRLFVNVVASWPGDKFAAVHQPSPASASSPCYMRPCHRLG
jgi:hypothetical protein